MTWQPAVELRVALLYLFGSNIAAAFGSFLVPHHNGRLLGTLEIVFWMALNLCAIHLPQQRAQLVRSGVIAKLLTTALVVSSFTALFLILNNHSSGYHLYVLNGFLLAGLALATLRRRYESRYQLDPAFLRQASDLELKLLEAAIKLGATTEVYFHALEENILGGDLFDSELLQARSEALNRLIAARYVSYKIPADGSLKQLEHHPDADTLLAAEYERRKRLWDEPAAKPGPRQRSSALAERTT